MAKQVIIKRKHLKKTLFIRNTLNEVIRQAFEEKLEPVECATKLFEEIKEFRKKERKKAMKLLLEDLHDADRKKLYDYAEEVVRQLKTALKQFDETNKDIAKYMIKQHKKAQEHIEKNKDKEPTPHPFGTGMERIKNEILHRPALILAEWKTKSLLK